MKPVHLLDLTVATASGPAQAALTQPCSSLAGRVVTLGHLDKRRRQNRLTSYIKDDYFYFTGDEFVRSNWSLLAPFASYDPEPRGFLSTYPRRAVWRQLLDYETEHFGSFQQGDWLRITDQYRLCTLDQAPRTPKLHGDIVEQPDGSIVIADPHVYLVAGHMQDLNTQVPAQPLPPLPEHLTKLATSTLGLKGDDRPLRKFLKSHGGLRNLQPGEIALMNMDVPHCSAAGWGTILGCDQEFGRLKVLRVQQPGLEPQPYRPPMTEAKWKQYLQETRSLLSQIIISK